MALLPPPVIPSGPPRRGPVPVAMKPKAVPPAMTGQNGIGAAAAARMNPATMQQERVKAGLDRIKAHNQGVTRSLGLDVDAAGNQRSSKSFLGTTSLAGQDTAASGPPIKPRPVMAAQQPVAPTAPVTPAPTPPAAGVPQIPQLTAQGGAAMPPPAPVAPKTQAALPPAKAQIPTPDDYDPAMALNEYAKEQIGTQDWKDHWGRGNGAKVGVRSNTDGPYRGKTMDQTRIEIEKNFRNLPDKEKRRYHAQAQSLRGTASASLRQPDQVPDADYDGS